MSDDYEQLLLQSVGVSEDIANSSLELTGRVHEVKRLIINHSASKLTLNFSDNTKHYRYSNRYLASIFAYISKELATVDKVVYYFNSSTIELYTQTFELQRNSEGIYTLRKLWSQEQRVVAPHNLKKSFDLLENIFLSSKNTFILAKSKRDLALQSSLDSFRESTLEDMAALRDIIKVKFPQPNDVSIFQ